MLAYVMEIFRAIILVIASFLIVVTAIGILRLKDEMDKVIYVRIHILGMMDIASVLALIGLNQMLLAGIYFLLAPFLAHAMANAYYYGEDECHYENNCGDNGVNGVINNQVVFPDSNNNYQEDIKIKHVSIDEDDMGRYKLEINDKEIKHD